MKTILPYQLMGISLLLVVSAFTLLALGESPQQSGASTPPRVAVRPAAIRGIWWSSEQPQSAAFVISDSTVYYPDLMVERTCRLSGDTLIVHFEDGYLSRSVIVRATPDTLVLSTEKQERIYTRSEPQR